MKLLVCRWKRKSFILIASKGTFALPEISFRESKEMAFFGSKVLFPKMIDCCEKHNIPIEVRKVGQREDLQRVTYLCQTTLEKNVAFTVISQRSTLLAAVSCIQRVAVIIVSGSGMKGAKKKMFVLFCCLHESGLVGTASKIFFALKDAKGMNNRMDADHLD